jgi:hypothetical protein
MRAMGMKQRVFGSYRTLGPDLLAQAGADAPRASKPSFPTTPRATTRAGSTSTAASRLASRAAGAVRLAGLRRHERAARLHLQGRIESRAHSRRAGRHRAVRRRDRAHGLRSQPEECRAAMYWARCTTAPITYRARDDGEAAGLPADGRAARTVGSMRLSDACVRSRVINYGYVGMVRRFPVLSARSACLGALSAGISLCN